MPQFQSKKVTLPNGKTFIINSDEEAYVYSKSFEEQGLDLKQLKIEDYTPPRPLGMKDYATGGVLGAVTGGIGGAPGGPWGVLGGAAIGGTMGALMPPKTAGDYAAMATNMIPTGKIMSPVLKNAPGVVKAVAPAAQGLLEANMGAGAQSLVDKGKFEGVSPFSVTGALSMALPTLGSKMHKNADETIGPMSNRMTKAFPGMASNLTPEFLGDQWKGKKVGSAITDFAFKQTTPVKEAVTEQATVAMKPFQDIVAGYDSQSTQLQQQLDALTQTQHTGFFSAARNLSRRIGLEKEMYDLDTRRGENTLKLAQMELAAIQNRQALNKVTGANKTANKLTDAVASTEVEKERLAKIPWMQRYEQDLQSIIMERGLTDKQKSQGIKMLKSRYKEAYLDFDEEIGNLKVDAKNAKLNRMQDSRNTGAEKCSSQTWIPMRKNKAR